MISYDLKDLEMCTFSLKSAILGKIFFKKNFDEPFLEICKKWLTRAFVDSGVFRTNALCAFTEGFYCRITIGDM